MKKLWCLKFEDFKRVAYKTEWDLEVPKEIAIISINNGKHTSPPEEYHICKSSENVLNLDFDDCDPICNGLPDNIETYECSDGIILEFFTDKMANEAIKFIESNMNRNKIDGVNFVIHCSAGISRSQAFVKFIKNVYSDYDWETNPHNPCIHPNGFVYQKLMQTFRSR